MINESMSIKMLIEECVERRKRFCPPVELEQMWLHAYLGSESVDLPSLVRDVRHLEFEIDRIPSGREAVIEFLCEYVLEAATRAIKVAEVCAWTRKPVGSETAGKRVLMAAS